MTGVQRGEVPAILLLGIGIVVPLVGILIQSFAGSGSFSVLGNYGRIFEPFRLLAVFLCLVKAVVALIIVYFGVIIPLNIAVLGTRKWVVTWIEVALLAPFCISSTLRLLGMRFALSADGLVLAPVPQAQAETISGVLLFQWWTEIAAIALSYGALLVLPYLHDLRSKGKSTIDALRDMGLPRLRTAAQVMPLLGSRGTFLGIAMFMTSAAFASLEYALVGKGGLPIPDMVYGMLQSDRPGAAAVTATLTAVMAIACFGLFRRVATPTRA